MSVWNWGETKWHGDITTYFILYFPWYRWGQTSFRAIETFLPNKLLGFGKRQGHADTSTPFQGQRVASEASPLSTEVWYRVLERVYGAQRRQRASSVCACRRLPIPHWAFESYILLTNSLSQPLLSGGKTVLEHVRQGRECCNSSKLSNPPHGGRSWIVFTSVGFCSPSSMKV